MTKAVLLDFYGTLAHAATWGPTRAEVLEAHGFTVPDEPRAPSAWAIAELCAPWLRNARYDEPASFSLSPNYLSPLSAETALREGRVGKLHPR